MKTQVIQLDHTDDIISAKDKLLWSKSPRIILVIPKQSEYHFSYVDLSLLNRQALRQGLQLAIVSQNSDIYQFAEALDISIFASVRDANRSRWKRSRLKYRRKDHNPAEKAAQRGGTLITPNRKAKRELPAAMRMAAFLLGLLSFSSIFFLLIPRAEITITENNIPQEMEFEVYGVLTDNLNSSSAIGKIAIRKMETIIVKDGEIASTGFQLLPKTKAMGDAIVSNLSFQIVEIPAGTVFATLDPEPIRFITTKSVVLPAGISEQIEVRVEAVEPGVGGNISAGTLAAIEGELGSMISVQNFERFTGGEMEKIASPTQSDFDALKASLLDEMLLEAVYHFASRDDLTKLFLPTTTIFEAEQKADYFPSFGEPGEKLHVSLQNEYSCWYLLEDELMQTAKFILDANLMEGFSPVSDDIELTYLDEPSIQEDGLTWRIKAKRLIGKRVNEDEINSLIAGRNVDLVAQLIMARLDSSSEPAIHLSPDWWRFMPIFSSRIDLVVNQ